jgi:hypothetical protein
MMAADIDLAPTTVHTESVPLVSRWDTDDAGTIYVLDIDDAGVSVPLLEHQVRALGAAILAATLDEIDEDDEGLADA